MNWQYIDTHAHLNLSAFAEDVDAVAQKCAEESVAVINIGTKQSTSTRAVELAGEYEHCYAMVGLHPIQTTPEYHSEEEVGGPSFTSKGEEFDTDYYRELAQQTKVVGIGECGFDYYRLSEVHGRTPGVHMNERMKVESGAQWHNGVETYETQETAFIKQIELANELGLPLMIHTRNPKPGEASPTGRSVYADVYDTLKRYAKVPFNVHFYAGTLEEAKKFFDLGGTISFTGVITFAKDYEEVVKAAPLELIHGETDCPYVAPKQYRGQRCEPWMTIEVYKKIAELKGLDEEVVREQLIANAKARYTL
jgi:TatD DNase family protein